VPEAEPTLISRLDSSVAEVRAAAIGALALCGSDALGTKLTTLLADPDADVRRAAAEAAGERMVTSAADSLVRLATDPEAQVRAAGFDSLRLLHDARALPSAIAALEDPATQTAAIAYVAELGGPASADSVIRLATKQPSESIAIPAAQALAKWSRQAGLTAAARQELERATGEIQGRSGLVVYWRMSGPLAKDALADFRQRLLAFPPRAEDQAEFAGWLPALAQGSECRVSFPVVADVEQTWLAYADVVASEEAAVQFVAGAAGKWHVWLNGRLAYERTAAQPLQAGADRFAANLSAGSNRIVVQLSSPNADAALQLRFRRQSSAAEIERLVQAALTRAGDAQRGRSVFLDTAKAQCIKCHRLDNIGERIGPELTGVGDRFSRMHIIESILEPSRTVTAGFQTINVRLDDGQSIAGLKLSETDATLTLADAKGEKHTLAKARIEEQQPQSKSLMPDGLAQQLSSDQFVDLVAFLVSQKKQRGPAAAARP
jgi:putative heme-binding domain-containing protein